MLFWLKEERAAAGVDLEVGEYVESLENLGEAGFRRDHLVMGDRKVLEKVMSLDLSRRAKVYYGSLLSKFSTIAGVGREIKRVFVSTGCHAPVREATGWTVPLSSFSDVDSVARSILIVEHMYDYDVMRGLAELHLIERNISSLVSLNFIPAAGGGGGSHLALAVYQRDVKGFGLCVLDSDKPHVLGAVGGTAAKCGRAFVESWRWNMHVIEARELENLISPAVMNAAGVMNPFPSNSYFTDDKWEITGYADTKLGDYLCRFRQISPISQSYPRTKAALDRHFAHVSDCDEDACEKASCLICAPASTLLADVARAAEAGHLRKLRKLPERVAALNSLVSDITSVGAAAAWKII